MLDPQGFVISWNAGAERIKGYTAAEIIGSHVSRFHPPDGIAKGWPQHELRMAMMEGRLFEELATCRYVDEKVAVLIAGRCGTGKSHLAQA